MISSVFICTHLTQCLLLPDVFQNMVINPRPEEYPADSLYKSYKSYDFSEVDRFALAAPESVTGSISTLAGFVDCPVMRFSRSV